MLIETYFDQKVQWNFLQSGIFLTTLEHHLRFHGIRWTLSNKTSSFTGFHGILSRSNIPWNSMELFLYSWVPWNSMEFHCIFLNSLEFHGIWLNWYFKNSYSKYCCWNLIADYISFWGKISQKRSILNWFQYRNSYFEHLNVSENGTRSAKMACCLLRIIKSLPVHLWLYVFYRWKK